METSDLCVLNPAEFLYTGKHKRHMRVSQQILRYTQRQIALGRHEEGTCDPCTRRQMWESLLRMMSLINCRCPSRRIGVQRADNRREA